jgi:saccharopine dehydrogenase-like NADP-dependent oxidoreductase
MVNVNEIQRIGVLGAGRSAGYLIEYLGAYCQSRGKTLKVYDQQFDRLKGSFNVRGSTELCEANLGDAAALDAVISGLQLVVSVLPPFMHIEVAKACLKHGCHLFTASYTSNEMKLLGEQAEAKGLLFMNELGLDPGIDHLSASRLFEEAHQKGFVIESFESHCGGLVAMEDCGENPWRYKFTWNPTNVVLAGQGGDSVWREQGVERHVAGMNIFASAQKMEVPGLGVFDVYPNRNSLTYEALYGLEEASTLLRGTLRREGYCQAWNELVEMGFTNSVELLEVDCAAAWFTLCFWVCRYGSLVGRFG